MTPPKKKAKLNEEGESYNSHYDFSTLPYDALLHIFKYLDFKSIAHCAILCRTFYNVSNESVIYNSIVFKYNMDKRLLEKYISKANCPKHLSVEYRFFDISESETEEDYSEFDDRITRFLKNSGSSLTSICFESCRNDNILSMLSECPNLTSLSLTKCKGTFQALPTLTNLVRLRIFFCTIPNKVIQDTLKNNIQLQVLELTDNTNVNPNDACESIAAYNTLIEEIHLGEKKKLRTKGIKALARCRKLRILEIFSTPCHADPEDSLQQLAAGCPLLEKLTLNGWKEVNDDNLLPILHSCTQLKELDLRGINITIKSCREAALSLPFLHTLSVYKCQRIKRTEVAKLQRDFKEINITN